MQTGALLPLQVGLWAQKHLPTMDVPALRAFSEVLDVDNPDLFKWLTGQAPAEGSVAENPSFQVRVWMQGLLHKTLFATVHLAGAGRGEHGGISVLPGAVSGLSAFC